jgi:hypothetical protein
MNWRWGEQSQLRIPGLSNQNWNGFEGMSQQKLDFNSTLWSLNGKIVINHKNLVLCVS